MPDVTVGQAIDWIKDAIPKRKKTFKELQLRILNTRHGNWQPKYVEPDAFIINYNRLHGIESEIVEQPYEIYGDSTKESYVRIINPREKDVTTLILCWSKLEEHGFRPEVNWVTYNKDRKIVPDEEQE